MPRELLPFPYRKKILPLSADENRCIRPGLLKIKYKVAYADAFGIELASDSKDHVLVTADYGVRPAEHDIRIEFLPTKPKP
jgi:hypothetical protein